MFFHQCDGDENLCHECQEAWHRHPIGALTRRWTAESADVNGRQSGLVCEKCKGIVRKRNARAALGRQHFHYVNPSSACVIAPTSPTGATAAFGRLAPEEQVARRLMHDEEVRKRLGWCLENGLTPAAEHVHRAPGCDARFMVCTPTRRSRTGTCGLQGQTLTCAFSLQRRRGRQTGR